MTRDYNNQRRDDARPPFRDRSSNNNGDERSPRPARPRLNREIVDRAWESGAQHQHADYRPRTNNGQPPRNNWHNQSPSEYSSSQNGHGGSRPYNNNRQDQYRDNPRRFERTSNDNYSPRSRSSGLDTPNQRDSEGRRFSDRRGYEDRPQGPRPPYRDHYDNGQSRGRDSQFRNRDQDRDPRRRDFERNESAGRNFEQGRRPFGTERRETRGPQEQRPRPDASRPQGRPWVRRDGQTNDRQEGPRPARYGERFEGDYERFDKRDNASSGKPAFNRRPNQTGNKDVRPKKHDDHEEPAEELHVTRLPDGRVLKGPRPVQRKEAQFWTEISEDTESLISQVHVPPAESPDTTAQSDGTAEVANTENEPAKLRKPRTRSASATVRAKTAKKEGAKGPRPSQRGFKWPTT